MTPAMPLVYSPEGRQTLPVSPPGPGRFQLAGYASSSWNTMAKWSFRRIGFGPRYATRIAIVPHAVAPRSARGKPTATCRDLSWGHREARC